MNSKIFKVFFIILIILIIIIMGFLYYLNSNVNNKDNKVNDIPSAKEAPEVKEDEISPASFYRVKNCISTYLSTINKNNSSYYGKDKNGNYTKVIEEDVIKSKIYNLLSKTYIEKNNIVIYNVYNYVYNIQENVIFNVLDMKKIANSSIKQYVVYGFIQNTDNKFIEYAYFVVNLDETNNIFSIEQINEEYSSINDIKVEDTSLEKNDDNYIPNPTISTEYICREYLVTYKRFALTKPELAYEYLDEEYRNKRFGDVETFKKFVEENKEFISQIALKQYLVNVYDDYKEYVCTDQYGNLYIFDEKKITDYSLTLDTYTLEYEKFTTEYAKADESKKAMMNIDKFFQMINARDYRTSYKVLDDGFKNNYFKTEEEFANYMKTNFFKGNKIEFKDVKNEGNILIYTISITDTTGQNTQAIEKTFIIKLEEGTDFVLSFNVE